MMLFFSFIFISWRLITLQYCSGSCHTLTWISHGFTCVPHPDPPSHLPLYPIPLGLPSAPGPSTCLMHPTWAGDLFHPRCCFLTVMLEKTLESPLYCKEIQPVNPKGNQLWIFMVRTDAEAEAPILWPPDAKNWLIGKDPDAGKDWRQEEKGVAEDEMFGWHHQLDGVEHAPGAGDGQGGLVCCNGVTKSWTQLTEMKIHSD